MLATHNKEIHQKMQKVIDLVLFKSKRCTLCDIAKEQILMTGKKLDREFKIKEIDIYGLRNEKWKELYKNDIPVGLIRGKEVFRHRVDIDDFIKKINELEKF